MLGVKFAYIHPDAASHKASWAVLPFVRPSAVNFKGVGPTEATKDPEFEKITQPEKVKEHTLIVGQLRACDAKSPAEAHGIDCEDHREGKTAVLMQANSFARLD